MAENNIELKSVGELFGMKFFIPSYQRGYRWTEQQVKDLLNDVKEFIDNQTAGFYSLQPLVVKKRWKTNAMEEIKGKASIEEIENYINNCEWEVIDGQQRLTTIYIILNYLGTDTPYSIDYQTREGFCDFLNNIIEEHRIITNDVNKYFDNLIAENKSYDNIDFYHILTTHFTTIKWFDNEPKVDKTVFLKQLLNNVKFIWYESAEKDPIKVFTRLNIGKIKLTNSELIKALMLNRSNFDEETPKHIQLRQQEIASEWDRIEYTLQNDEFWMFLHEEKDYSKPTRIDFIFDLICNDTNNGMIVFSNEEEKNKVIGNDDYSTFRYFYEFFQREKKTHQYGEKHSAGSDSIETPIEKCWKEVKKYFQTFQEWFDDLTLYHYIGYLRCPVKDKDNLISIATLVGLWKDGKDKFVDEIKERIIKRIHGCNDLDKQYEIGDNPAKTKCKPILLLHNVQTVINQNIELKSKKEYGLPVFYKFPFHLYKKEMWDVEHIDSNTTNVLDKEKDQKEWLRYSLLDNDVLNHAEISEQIRAFLDGAEDKLSFEDLAQTIEKLSVSRWKEPEKDKNKIWNFVLLDAGTNRGYGNAIFPAKRRCIIGKDQGEKYIIDSDLKIMVGKGEVAFVPPVTKNVFLKYYNSSVENIKAWGESDAKGYRENIYKTLKDFCVIDSSKEYNHDNQQS